ncbi:MAG TPA: protein kinase [Polyangiaceae bacterium]|nr:protein kinase [Polyangiaceae bacterium]
MSTPRETPPPGDGANDSTDELDGAGPLRPGDMVHKYRIEETIGRGGHAHVYRALDTFFEHHVALKVLHRPGGVTKDMLRRGQAEAKLLVRLRHPNIVEVVDASVTDRGHLFIVMELLTGRSFRDVLRQFGKLEVDEALALFAQIADGMEAAHRHGAIHRDLKPENIFVVENNVPKILDFGIAKVVDSAGMSTRKDIVLGTALYMSPEQLQGIPVTPRSDIFALGVMLYEALLGRHPSLVEGSALTLQEVAWRQTTRMPPLLSTLDKSIPRSVARLVNQAITKLPKQRFATMAEFAEVMREHLGKYSKERARKRKDPTTRDLSKGPAPNAVSLAPTPLQPAFSAPTVVARVATHDTEPYSPAALSEQPSIETAPQPPLAAVGANEPASEVFKPAARPLSARKLPTPSATPVVAAQRTSKPRVDLPSFVSGAPVRAVLLMGLAVGAAIGTGGALHHFASLRVEESQTVAAVPSNMTVPRRLESVATAPVVSPPPGIAVPTTTSEPSATEPREAPAVEGQAASPSPAPTTASPQASPSPSSSAIARSHPFAASRKTDKMQERLKWLERDLDEGKAAPPPSEHASPAATEPTEANPKPRAWATPQREAPATPSSSARSKSDFWIKPQ